MPEKLIRHSGNYRKLLSYQKTEVIYEMTFFCKTKQNRSRNQKFGG